MYAAACGGFVKKMEAPAIARLLTGDGKRDAPTSRLIGPEPAAALTEPQLIADFVPQGREGI
jgi:hypothetical protein